MTSPRHIHRFAPRRGVVVPTMAVLLPVLLVLLGFAVDLAYMQKTRAELRFVADCAARAGAADLARNDSTISARAVATRIAEANTVAGQPLRLGPEHIQFGRSTTDATGRYNFISGARPYTSVRVLAERAAGSPSGAVPLYFGSFIGREAFDSNAEAVASFVNYDVCLVLDRSSSMKLDLDDPGKGMSISDPRLCLPPGPNSRWMALDQAVDVFVGVLKASPASEKVSLSTYASFIGNQSWVNNCSTPHRTVKEAYIDLALTANLKKLTNEVGIWSSSIFNGNTHIEEGIRTGIRAVTGSGSRATAEKVLIVLTDGHQNVGEARNAAVDCAAQGILCHAITFSDDADRALMAEVASIGGGMHLHARTEAELVDAFKMVAGELTRITD